MSSLCGWLTLVCIDAMQLFLVLNPLPPTQLKSSFWHGRKWQLGLVIARDERMVHGLQGRQPLLRVHLQDLLNKVNELKDFETFLFAVLQRHLV